MTRHARGSFDITMQPGPAEIGGRVGRFDFDKSFSGDIEGTGRGVMLSGGNPQSGSAGYVAIEVVTGRLGGRMGSFALQQFGQLNGGDHELRYEVVGGSGTDALQGLQGTLHLTIDGGIHNYDLTYTLP